MVVLSGRLRRWRRVLTSQCCNLRRGQTKGAATGINRRLRVAGSHIVPLRVLSVGNTGGPGGDPSDFFKKQHCHWLPSAS